MAVTCIVIKGKEESLTLNNVSVITASVSHEMTPHPASLQKQLHLAIRKIEAYRKQIETLQNQLDDSEVERIFEKLRRFRHFPVNYSILIYSKLPVPLLRKMTKLFNYKAKIKVYDKSLVSKVSLSPRPSRVSQRPPYAMPRKAHH